MVLWLVAKVLPVKPVIFAGLIAVGLMAAGVDLSGLLPTVDWWGVITGWF